MSTPPPSVADSDGYYLALYTFNEGRPDSVEMVRYPLSSWTVIRAYCETGPGAKEIRWGVAEVWLFRSSADDLELEKAMVQRWERK